MSENLIELITEEMAADDDDMDEQSDRLIDTYLQASEESKAAVDAAFVCLCGWSLKTLIEKYRESI